MRSKEKPILKIEQWKEDVQYNLYIGYLLFLCAVQVESEFCRDKNGIRQEVNDPIQITT